MPTLECIFLLFSLLSPGMSCVLLLTPIPVASDILEQECKAWPSLMALHQDWSQSPHQGQTSLPPRLDHSSSKIRPLLIQSQTTLPPRSDHSSSKVRPLFLHCLGGCELTTTCCHGPGGSWATKVLFCFESFLEQTLVGLLWILFPVRPWLLDFHLHWPILNKNPVKSC